MAAAIPVAIGARVAASGVDFRVWSPGRKRVEVVLQAAAGRSETIVPLAAEDGGYFAGHAREAQAGDLYRYRLDGGGPFPDPASRFLPEGPHGPSQVVEPAAFAWTDIHWPGVALPGQVIYELHIGTFTPAGTWRAAQRELPALAELGVTVLEVMPVADFPGAFGWGYDGVDLYAPTRLYGAPDDFRAFVDAAHGLGLGVILDVVYNHIGPDGNYLTEFSPDYFTDRYQNEWGEAINFDGPQARPVREFFAGNAAYWVEEFHLDGLRLDATQQIFDRSSPHILREIACRVRAAAKGRATIIVAENEPQEARLVRPVESGGYGLDGLWNDDLHHSTRVALSGCREAYYTDYRGSPQEFISAAKWGYLFQGQRYQWQRAPRGQPALDIAPAQFIIFLENHDQIANSGKGQRIQQLTSPGRYRALTALILLLPGTPLLFQGQEFAASTPFLFFADHHPELAKLVRQGRAKFLQQFPSLSQPEMQAQLHDPADRTTFENCKLDFSQRQRHADAYRLHRDLLRLRREEAAFRAQLPRGLDGAVLGAQAWLLRFFGPAPDGRDDRILLMNLGPDLPLSIAPEPLLAPAAGRPWEVQWSSERLAYGGNGSVSVESEAGWLLPGESATVLRGAGG
jgi:maltooligosyltrehalose trehalohydrolase